MSKYDIRPQFECQNRILNVKIRYSADLECQKMEKPKAKNEKRIIKNEGKNEKRKTNNEKRKAKNEKRKTNQLNIAQLNGKKM